MPTSDNLPPNVENLLASILEVQGTIVDFSQHGDAILQLLDKMGDEQSKTNFRNEMVTLVLRSVSLGFLEQFDFTMSSKTLERRFASIPNTHFPELEFPEHWHYPDKMVAYTFLFPQYEYEDKVTLQEGDVFLDCGACGGEVALWARHKVGDNGKVIAFEPHPKTFEVLTRNVQKYAPDIKLKQSAIGNSNGYVNFSDDAAPWSAINEQSKFQVPIVRIDDFCAANKVVPTFVKMDIEGAEVDALLGARETIATHLPNLAICTYHKPEHLYQVGETINAISDRYTFYFRKHHPVWEAVLYATARTS